jgi:hypothetical protein
MPPSNHDGRLTQALEAPKRQTQAALADFDHAHRQDWIRMNLTIVVKCWGTTKTPRSHRFFGVPDQRFLNQAEQLTVFMRRFGREA